MRLIKLRKICTSINDQLILQENIDIRQENQIIIRNIMLLYIIEQLKMYDTILAYLFADIFCSLYELYLCVHSCIPQ